MTDVDDGVDRAVVDGAVDDAVADAFRQEWGRVLATLIAMTGDWDLAEECTQDAFAQALRSWPGGGIPRRPGAWLTTVARNRTLDRLHRRSIAGAKIEELGVMQADQEPPAREADPSGIADDRLRLIFTCCHPALPLEARTALTLRTLAGLTTGEIARAFLVPEATMAKRLVRAKHKIRSAGIPYRVPPVPLLAERTSGVLAVLYLLFNEGYAGGTGEDLMRQELSAEAIRLGRLLTQLMPDEPEVLGLLALLLFQDARRLSRFDQAGELVTLEEQDRSFWDGAEIEEGVGLLQVAFQAGEAGPYLVQAAIASCHATSEAATTDWAEIARLFRRLARVLPSPVVDLNRAVAIAMVDGPLAGLDLLDTLEPAGALSEYHLLPATRADLLRRLGRTGEAAASYRRALELVPTDIERRFLLRRLIEVEAGS
jgi:RNA polymerase sigma-70 factor, ECF subfamily